MSDDIGRFYREKAIENQEQADYYANILKRRNIPKTRKKEIQSRQQYFSSQAEKHRETAARYPNIVAAAAQKWPYDHTEKHRQAALKGHGK